MANNKLGHAIKAANRMAACYGSVATLAMLGMTASVNAQENTIEEVVVTGVYASQQNAINTKRNAASVVDAISAEDIGKLPDVTIADSLQRIPGIQVERTAGRVDRYRFAGCRTLPPR